MKSTRGINKMALLIIGVIIIFAITIYASVNINPRHYRVGDKLYVAPFLTFPGYIEVFYPEQEVDLRNWVGSKYDSLKAVNKDDNTENKEATAGLALKTTGLYNDYELKKKGDHYILYRPSKTERIFTMQAFYRVWFGKPDNLK